MAELVLGKALLDAETIHGRIAELSIQIQQTLPPGELHIIVILNGAMIFAADLARQIARPCLMDFWGWSSYGDKTSPAPIKMTHSLDFGVADKDILVLDDIVDTGVTLDNAVKCLLNAGARSIYTCVLLNKPSKRVNGFKADFCGFDIPDEFVVGYGLDYGGRYRNLPFVATMETK